MLTPITYQPGTAKANQHTVLSSLAFDSTDKVRFQLDGRMTTIPAYASTPKSIKGSCRAIYAQRITGTHAADSYFFGTHSYLYVQYNGTLYNITPLSQSSAALANNALTTVNASSVVTVAQTAHGKTVGDRFKLAGATDTRGITAATYLNIEHIITVVVDANNFKFDCGFNATSSGTGGGAGIIIYAQIAAGNQAQVAAAGMGAGNFGGGNFGGGGTSTTGLQAYPRIWSFDAFGDDVVMCPGDRTAGEGQYIYIWDGNTSIAPTKLTNAPTTCNWVMVVNNSVVAFCGRTVNISQLGDATIWSGLDYYSNTLEHIDVVHSGFRQADKNAVLHHGNGALLLQYTGDANIWDISDIFEDDGAISPMATAKLGHILVWRGRTGFYRYDGGIVQKVFNLQNDDWIIRNLNTAVAWHCFMVADTQNQEFYFHFPIGSSGEPSDYVIIGNTPDMLAGKGWFTLGTMSRTAGQRPGIFSSTFYMADTANVYSHFTNGAVTFSWSATTSYFLADGAQGEMRVFMNEYRPDANQSGDITLQINAREYAQSATVTQGSWTISYNTPVQSVKAAGRLFQFKFSGSAQATMGNPSVNIKALGHRAGKVA